MNELPDASELSAEDMRAAMQAKFGELSGELGQLLVTRGRRRLHEDEVDRLKKVRAEMATLSDQLNPLKFDMLERFEAEIGPADQAVIA